MGGRSRGWPARVSRRVARSSSRSATRNRSAARPGWVERVTQWVEKGKRQQVTTIDPALVPTGQVRIVELTDDTASCDAVVQVTTGTGPAWVDVVAQRGIGAAPDWFVVEWSPHESR